MPELYGNFACNNYTAEGVVHWSIPVQVTATQIQGGVAVTASTQFYDPAITLEGYTLRPNPGWTAGDVKGYNEGDSVPFKVKLEKNAFGPNVTVTLGFDYRDANTSTYGIDYLTEYNLEPPASPFNIYPSSSTPFWVSPSEGTITDQSFVDIRFDSGASRDILVWQFTLQFATGVSSATVRWGAHMAVTDIPNNYYGASYFPGSSLHVRIVDLDPPTNQGNRDVPIALGGAYPVLTPPNMTLDKWVEPLLVPDPQTFKIGDTITFTIRFSNIGQADAKCVLIDDYLPSVVAYVSGSSVLWTSENPAHLTFPPAQQTSTWLEWGPTAWRGTGVDGALAPLVGYIQFQAIVLPSATPGIYWNNVYLSYNDDHGGLFDTLHAQAPFEIVGEPSLTIEKSGPLYAHVGDTIIYTYVVTNTGPTDIVDLDVYDDVAGWIVQNAFLAHGASVTYTKSYTILASGLDPLRNNVTANGKDQYGQFADEAKDDWKVDILHPSIHVEKSADKSCAAVGESVSYTIFYENTATDDTVLYNVTITDSLLGISQNVGTLNPGQSGHIYKTIAAVEVVSDPNGEMPNTVTATGHDILKELDDSFVSDTASWTVDIKHPAITIDKWATYVGEVARLGCVGEGDVIVWHITVTNPSTDTAMSYNVYDPLLSDAVNDWLFGGTLSPGTSFSWTSDNWTVPVGVEDPLVNIAWVIASDSQNHYVHADTQTGWPTAVVTLDVLHPGITIDKWATYVDNETRLVCVGEGDVIIWHITVTNPSSDTVMFYNVTDAMLSAALDGWLFGGVLSPLGSISWTSSEWTVPVGVADPLVNTAVVMAHDAQGHPAYGQDGKSWPSDTVTLEVFHPAITIDKWATYVRNETRLGCVGEGDVILWHITVTNPSSDT
ncbi:DUF11 domain-containing protein, partial [bacterium]|nr:DUF11 domain-containing protein [bacterium]